MTEMDFWFCGPKISSRIYVEFFFFFFFFFFFAIFISRTVNMHINKVIKFDNVCLMFLSAFQYFPYILKNYLLWKNFVEFSRLTSKPTFQFYFSVAQKNGRLLLFFVYSFHFSPDARWMMSPVSCQRRYQTSPILHSCFTHYIFFEHIKKTWFLPKNLGYSRKFRKILKTCESYENC